jgi:parvulin-like peptidyl-prolyl isomerase
VRVIVALAVALLLAGCGAAAGDPSVAAAVDADEIPVDEVQRRFSQLEGNEQFAAQLAEDADGAFRRDVQAQILTSLIHSEVLEDWAADLGIEATEEEVKAQRDDVVEQLGGEEAFQQALEQNGLTEADAEELLRQQVLQQELTQEVAGTPLTDEEIAAFYEENKETRFGGTATARHILVEDEKTANDLRRRLEQGEDFAALAEEFSTDTGSGAQGGQLPPYSRGQTAPEFDEVLFSAPVGELVGPVQTQFGFHLVEVLERSEARPLAEVEDEIRNELQTSQQEERFSTELMEQTQAAEVVVNPRFGEWDTEQGVIVSGSPLGRTTEGPNAGGPVGTPPEGQLPIQTQPTAPATE